MVKRPTIPNLMNFWEKTARKIKPDHKAPSTEIYLGQEKALIDEFFPPLKIFFFLKPIYGMKLTHQDFMVD